MGRKTNAGPKVVARELQDRMFISRDSIGLIVMTITLAGLALTAIASK